MKRRTLTRISHYIFVFIVIAVSLHFYVAYHYYSHWRSMKTTSIVESQCFTTAIKHRNYLLYCDRKHVTISQPCVCYADIYSEGEPFNSNSAALFDPDTVKCAMTYKTAGRMGNQMGMYATLLVLARYNRRPAIINKRMALYLKSFKISLPILPQGCMKEINWQVTQIQRRMEPSNLNISGLFVALNGFPRSNTYFEGFEEEIRREFQLKGHIQKRAQKVLWGIASTRTTSSVTFIGVHARRGDYIEHLKRLYNGVVADRNYFSQATAYYRSKYADAVFVVVSSDMKWCKENIENDRNDVIYAGNGNESDAISDFALLVNCNHSIITMGSYGFFAAFLAAGDVVYFTNFTGALPYGFAYDAAYPKHWHAIAATNFTDPLNLTFLSDVAIKSSEDKNNSFVISKNNYIKHLKILKNIKK